MFGALNRSAASSWRASLAVTGVSVALLALLTVGLAALQNLADVGTVMITYMIAVLFAAIRGGIVPAVVTAVMAIGCAAFFFYPPIYDFRVHNPSHVIDLFLFIIVAVVTGKLANDVRKAKLREQGDMLREALIGSVSHELRTPLATIVGSASVLAQAPEVKADARLAPLVDGVREEAERLNEHIQNLLDSTRISSEGIRPQTEWVDPGDVVNAALGRKTRLLAAHTLKVEVEDDLPLVKLDPMMVEKALGQLIENAVKYSLPGSEITIKAEKIGGTMRFAVVDSGVGFSSEERDRLWDRFYRSSRHSSSVQGSGLGLWIARSLVEACGGSVDAFSAGIGRGATLSLHLPVQQHMPAAMDSADE